MSWRIQCGVTVNDQFLEWTFVIQETNADPDQVVLNLVLHRNVGANACVNKDQRVRFEPERATFQECEVFGGDGCLGTFECVGAANVDSIRP